MSIFRLLHQCKNSRGLLRASFLLSVSLGIPLTLVGQARYTVHDLGTLGQAGTFAAAVNNNGQVAGTGTTASGQLHAFRTRPNTSINPLTDDLGTLGGPSSSAVDLNDVGQVVGTSAVSDLFPHAFRTAPQAPINPATDDIGTFPGPPDTAANGINQQGQVVGFGSLHILNHHAFRTAPNRSLDPAADDLGSLSPGSFPQDTEANKINNSGVVVGMSTTVQGTQHAFRTAPNALINPLTDDLGTLGGSFSSATDINDFGFAVGLAANALEEARAFFAAPSSNSSSSLLIDLGTLGGLISGANGLNNSAEVVGYSTTTPQGDPRAFLFSGGAMLDLNTLTTSAPPLVLTNSADINDIGQIVASGTDASGKQHAFRLDPTAAGIFHVLLDTVGSFHLSTADTARLDAPLQSGLLAVQQHNLRSALQHLVVFDRFILLARGSQLSDAQVQLVWTIEEHAVALLLNT